MSDDDSGAPTTGAPTTGAPENDPDDHLASWYAGLEIEAAAVNHQIRVMVIPGPVVKVGQTLTVLPFEEGGLGLQASLSRIQSYLQTDEAKRRGELYAARAKAESEYLDALVALTDARARFRDASQAVEDDVDEATDTVTAEA